jgi:hypothetical protein
MLMNYIDLYGNGKADWLRPGPNSQVFLRLNKTIIADFTESAIPTQN